MWTGSWGNTDCFNLKGSPQFFQNIFFWTVFAKIDLRKTVVKFFQLLNIGLVLHDHQWDFVLELFICKITVIWGNFVLANLSQVHIIDIHEDYFGWRDLGSLQIYGLLQCLRIPFDDYTFFRIIEQVFDFCKNLFIHFLFIDQKSFFHLFLTSERKLVRYFENEFTAIENLELMWSHFLSNTFQKGESSKPWRTNYKVELSFWLFEFFYHVVDGWCWFIDHDIL